MLLHEPSLHHRDREGLPSTNPLCMYSWFFLAIKDANSETAGSLSEERVSARCVNCLTRPMSLGEYRLNQSTGGQLQLQLQSLRVTITAFLKVSRKLGILISR